MTDELKTKLHNIQNLINECLELLPGHSLVLKTSTVKKKSAKNNELNNHVLMISNKIKSCEENEKIEEKILDKASVLGRVLLPYYICYKYFPTQGLTTGDVAKITSELRIGVKLSNISTAITNSLQKYLEGDSTRVKGKPVTYKLNRKGAKHFESLLNGDE